MNWDKLIYQIESKFQITGQRKEPYVVEESQMSKNQGETITGEREVVEFQTPQGKFMLEKIEKPKVSSQKFFSNKRVGTHARVDRVYSTEEKTSQIKIYKLSAEGAWQEIDFKGMIQ